MTGKEALEYIANLLFMFTSAGRKSGKCYVLKALCKIEDELDELAKYKRAFEILKDRLMLKIYEEEYHYKQLYTLESSKEVRIDKEEYELLEELMKDEKN